MDERWLGDCMDEWRDYGHLVMRAKWTMDGSRTLAEAARLRPRARAHAVVGARALGAGRGRLRDRPPRWSAAGWGPRRRRRRRVSAHPRLYLLPGRKAGDPDRLDGEGCDGVGVARRLFQIVPVGEREGESGAEGVPGARRVDHALRHVPRDEDLPPAA